MTSATDHARWRRDAAAFIEEVLHNPETGELYRLTDAERRFVRKAFELTPDGRLKYPELVFSAPKKSGKTTLAAMIVLYVVLVAAGGKFAEAKIFANAFEQAKGRVYEMICRIIEASPLLAAEATITADRIEFPTTGARIEAHPSDAASAAGSNPNISVFDELWGYVGERAHRLWDELVPPPTRKIACRLTVTYAGYSGESDLLESLHRRGLQGEEIEPDLYAQQGMLMFWTNRFTAPWQTPEWAAQMRQQLRPNAYLRLIENRWVTSESTFIDLSWWDACVDPTMRPLLADRWLEVWAGVDASVKRDSTAIVVCTWDEETKQARLIWHRTFQPSPDDPLDFESTVEATLRELMQRYRVVEIRYDPFQMAAVAQRLQRDHLPMIEFAQTVPSLTAASSNLYELIKGRNIAVYPDADLRLAVQRSVAIETSRGWRIAKEKASHRIDVVVALAQAALGAVQSGQGSSSMATWIKLGTPDPVPASVIAAAEAAEAQRKAQAQERLREKIAADERRAFIETHPIERLRRGSEPLYDVEFAEPVRLNVNGIIVDAPAGLHQVPEHLPGLFPECVNQKGKLTVKFYDDKARYAGVLTRSGKIIGATDARAFQPEHVGSHPKGSKFVHNPDGSMNVSSAHGDPLAIYSPGQYELHDDGGENGLTHVIKIGEHDGNQPLHRSTADERRHYDANREQREGLRKLNEHGNRLRANWTRDHDGEAA